MLKLLALYFTFTALNVFGAGWTMDIPHGNHGGFWPAHNHPVTKSYWTDWFGTNHYGSSKDLWNFEASDAITERLLVASNGTGTYNGLTTNSLIPKWYIWEHDTIVRLKSAITNLCPAFIDPSCIDEETGVVDKFPQALTPEAIVIECGLQGNFFTYTPWIALGSTPTNGWDGVRKAINLLYLTTNGVTFIGTNHQGMSSGTGLQTYYMSTNSADRGVDVAGMSWYDGVDSPYPVLSVGTRVVSDVNELIGTNWSAWAINSAWSCTYTNFASPYTPNLLLCFDIGAGLHTDFGGCEFFNDTDIGWKFRELVYSDASAMATSTVYGSLSHPEWVEDPGYSPCDVSNGYDVTQPMWIVDWSRNAFRYIKTDDR